MNFKPPAFCVSEMISAHDVLYKHKPNSRYLFRSPQEGLLCYQIAGNEPSTMADAAVQLQQHGADLIDINCGCPKNKIRKKGAGSALLDNPSLLINIIATMRPRLRIPLTVKIRLSEKEEDLILAKKIEQAGADAVIVHGRHWTEDYAKPCNFAQIKRIKHAVSIPVIANGDITNRQSLLNAITASGCDAYMVSRAGTGHPWLYENLLHDSNAKVEDEAHRALFMQHLLGLARLENDYKAVLQSKSLFRYYFKHKVSQEQLQAFYKLSTLSDIESSLKIMEFIE